ncbi:MAG: PQQ-binding-like beta-propeller repeat protein [Armatimonadaceae bacterium]
MSDWTSFRNNGTPPSNLPNRLHPWTPGNKVKWRTELPGYGQSSPVNFGKLIFVTTVQGSMRDTNLVHAVDAASGKILWTQRRPTSLKHEMSYYVSRAAPTPVCDRAGVYALFESGDLYAYAHNGTPLWSRNLGTDYGLSTNEFGLGSSPAQTQTNLILVQDDPKQSYICCIAKATGATVWKKEREPRKSWTSPVIMRIANRDYAVISANGDLDIYDASTGEHTANFTGLKGNVLASVTPNADTVLIGATAAQARIAKPGAKLSPAESNCCIRLKTTGSKITPEVVWMGERSLSDFASPIVSGQLAYYVSASGIVSSVDIATGKIVFTERIDGECWATPISTMSSVLFFTKKGATIGLAHGRTFRIDGKHALWGDSDAPRTKEGFTTTSPGNPGGRGAASASGTDNMDPILYATIATPHGLIYRTGSHLFRVST